MATTNGVAVKIVAMSREPRMRPERSWTAWKRRSIAGAFEQVAHER